MTEWNPFWIKSQSASLFNPQAFATFLHSLRIEICIDVVFHLEMTMSIQEAGNGWRQASSTALPGALPCWRRPALWRPRASPSLPLEKYWWVHFQSHHRHQKCFFLKKRRENAGSNSRKTNQSRPSWVHKVSFWTSPDDGFNVDRMGGEGEEEEEEDDVIDHSEIQRRKERLEREQWLREQVG